MRKRFLSITVLLAIMAPASGLGLEEDMVRFLLQNSYNAWVLNEELAEGQRKEAIGYIKESRDDGPFRIARKRRILANLGDRETIEMIYLTNKDGYYGREFVSITHPAILQYAGDNVFQELGELRINNMRLLVLEFPHSVALSILTIAGLWGEFPPEVRAWADGVIEDSFWELPGTYLEDAREFWLLNREAILNEEYEKVVPLEQRYGESRPGRTRRMTRTDPADSLPDGEVDGEREVFERQERDGEEDETSPEPEDGV